MVARFQSKSDATSRTAHTREQYNTRHSSMDTLSTAVFHNMDTRLLFIIS